MLNRLQIERRVPHAGSMSLLDRVSDWNGTAIVCHAAAPTGEHPLRREGSVPAVAAVEYAAQAAAIHGSLLDGRERARAGLLAGVGGMELRSECIDGALVIQATLESAVPSGCSYAFEVRDERGLCARGRLTIAFGA